MAIYESVKDSLFRSFLNTKDRGLSDEQVQMARQCVTEGQTLQISEKYKIINFSLLVQQNKDLMKLNNALGLVLQYITGLLCPELPPNWFSISIRNKSYLYRMNNMIGVEDLLGLAGYTKRTRDFLSFPNGDEVKPDRLQLANLATEILLAREECSAAANKQITLNLHDKHVPSGSGWGRSGGIASSLNPPPLTGDGRCDSVGFTVQPQYANETHYSNHPPPQRTSIYTPPTQHPLPDEVITQPSNMYRSQTTPHQFNPPHPQRPQAAPRSSNQPIPKPRTKLLTKQPESNDSTSSTQGQFSGPISSVSSDEGSVSTESGSANNSGVIADTLPDETTIPETRQKKSEIALKREELRRRLQKYKEKDKNKPPPPPPEKSGQPSYSDPNIIPNMVDSPVPPSSNNMGKAATIANPPMPVYLRPKMTTPPTTQTIQEIDEEEVPDTPTKCPRCHSHLDASGICTYCSPAPSPSGSIESSVVTSKPVAKPRPKKRPSTDVQSIISGNIGPTPVPLIQPVVDNGLHNRPLNGHQQKQDNGDMDNQLATLEATVVGSDSMVSQSTLTNEATIGSDLSSSATSSSGAVGYADRPELDERFMKFQKEAEYFAGLSLSEQDHMLDGKIKHNDTTNHLKIYYKGKNWAGRKEQKEIEEFTNLNPDEQKDYLDQKNQRKEKITHLVPYYEAPNANQRAFEHQQDLKLKKKQRAKDDGRRFCDWIKTCAKKGYSPNEVEIALSHNNNPLQYLETKWQDSISQVITLLEFHKNKPGKPSREESRRFLIKAKGMVRVASGNCIKERLAKIEELEGKFAGKMKVEREMLVECLTQCDLNVEEAFYAVQQRNLAELYKYLLSSRDVADTSEDGKSEEKGKTDMDAMKDKVLEQTKDIEDKKAYNSCIRMLMAENKFKNSSKAEMLIDLLKEKSDYPMKYYIDAAKHYDTLEEATRFLNQPCQICTDTFLMDDMVVLPSCGDSLCKDCFVGHFMTVIKEKSVKHFHCPFCEKPDFSNNLHAEDITVGLLVAMVKELCDKETYNLCQSKLTDFNLSKQPNFVWCINPKCHSGFLTDRNDRLRVECPNCNEDMCFLCKKKWEHQHEGLTCDQFTQWKIDNDPEAQKQGLAAHLEENGIQCPACKFRYDLARGGCMHFRCTQCPNEFCSGCGGSMKKGDECGKFEWCRTYGFHAHHPRDCLFYLRDFEVRDLQELLRKNNVDFDTDPPKAQLDAAKEEQQKEDMVVQDIEDEDAVLGEPIAEADEGGVQGVELTCCVMLQKEGPDGLYDERCGKPTPDKMAGLCETHYKEYLVSKINKEKVDPSDLYPVNQLVRILEREEKEVPVPDDENDGNDEEAYRAVLIEHIKKELPLQRTASLNFISTK